MDMVLAVRDMYLRIAILILAACVCMPAQAGNIFRNMYSKDVKSGINTYIYKNDEIYPDCTASNLKANVSTYPRHGTLEMSQGAVENTYSQLMPQSKCSRKVSKGVKAFYQSKAGYKGKDKAVVYVTDAAGNTKYTTIYLNVR